MLGVVHTYDGREMKISQWKVRGESYVVMQVEEEGSRGKEEETEKVNGNGRGKLRCREGIGSVKVKQ